MYVMYVPKLHTRFGGTPIAGAAAGARGGKNFGTMVKLETGLSRRILCNELLTASACS